MSMSNTISKNRVRDLLPTHWGDLEGVVEQFFGPAGVRGSSPYFVPASLWEEGEAYHVELDVPGVARENIELKFENGALSISVERAAADESRKGLVDERRYGKTTRTVALPESIDPETIAAQLTDGVLHVTMSKKPEAQSKRIGIR
jgi:HSP20 family protein